jgi:hypothetical protein
MNEVLPGVLHWTTHHEGIGTRVHSHFAVESAALIDPRVPEGGIDEVARYGRPDRILLSNRHHLRHSERFAAAFGCPIRCHEAGLHEFEGSDVEVQAFGWGDELAPGVRALEVGVLCPEETALHIAAGDGFLAFADAIVRDDDGGLAFVSDWLLGDDPEAVKAGLRDAFGRLLETTEFDGLLLAHGDPSPSGGRAELERFVTG